MKLSQNLYTNLASLQYYIFPYASEVLFQNVHFHSPGVYFQTQRLQAPLFFLLYSFDLKICSQHHVFPP